MAGNSSHQKILKEAKSKVFNTLNKIIKKPSEEDLLVQDLMKDLDAFEVENWISHLIDQMAYAIWENRSEGIPPRTLEVWRSLSAPQQELVFVYLLGAVKGLMRPPEDFVGASVG